MHYYGDIALGDSIVIPFDTVNTSGGRANFTTDPTVRVYKDNDVAQITAGITFTEGFDGLTGVHIIEVDTSDPAYDPQADYTVVIVGGVIDSQTVDAVVGSFSIENRNNHDVIIGSVTDVPSDGTALRDSTKVATDDFYNGGVLLCTSGTLQGVARRIEDYDGTNREFSFAANPFPITIPTGTRFKIVGQIES